MKDTAPPRGFTPLSRTSANSFHPIPQTSQPGNPRRETHTGAAHNLSSNREAGRRKADTRDFCNHDNTPINLIAPNASKHHPQSTSAAPT